MRLFQHFEVYPAYQARMSAVTRRINDYVGKLRFLLDDRCEALHLLQPVLDGDVSAFATSGMSSDLQCSWAREHGLKSATPLVDILLAQIEEHRTEVFYDLAPLRFDGSLLRRLPGCVKKTIAWHAAPSFGVDFPYYNLVVSNFPNILELQRRRGCKTAFFYPAYDPEMADYAANRDRPIDVLFVGSYSRHHRRRAQLLEEFASLASEMSIQFFLNSSRFTQFAESTLGKMLPLAKYRRPNTLSAVTHPPIFGRDLYRAMSQ